MKKISLCAKPVTTVVLVISSILCLTWLGDIFRAASHLPWYKLLGAGVLCLSVAFVAILSRKDDRERERRREQRIVVEVEFEHGSVVDKYFEENKIQYEVSKSDFVRKAAIKEAIEQTQKREGRE